jgi:hypothetical protein
MIGDLGFAWVAAAQGYWPVLVAGLLSTALFIGIGIGIGWLLWG